MNVTFMPQYMEARMLEQPMASDECVFYVMWAILLYLGNNAVEGDKNGVYAFHSFIKACYFVFGKYFCIPYRYDSTMIARNLVPKSLDF